MGEAAVSVAPDAEGPLPLMDDGGAGSLRTTGGGRRLDSHEE